VDNPTNMTKQTKITLLLITILITGLTLSSKSLAQENANISLTLAPDLEVSSWATKAGIPKFLNNLQYTIRYLVTWNPLVKTKMELTKANESLIIAQQELLQSQLDAKNLANFEKAINRYQQEMQKINKRIEKFKKKADENSKINLLLNKLADSQLKQQNLLKELIQVAPAELQPKLKTIKESSLDTFANVLTKLENKDHLADRLIFITINQKDNQYKELNDLEILNALEKRLPEQEKAAIKKIQAITIYKLNYKLQNLPQEEAQKFAPLVKNLEVDEKIQSYLNNQVQKVSSMKIEPKSPIEEIQKPLPNQGENKTISAPHETEQQTNILLKDNLATKKKQNNQPVSNKPTLTPDKKLLNDNEQEYYFNQETPAVKEPQNEVTPDKVNNFSEPANELNKSENPPSLAPEKLKPNPVDSSPKPETPASPNNSKAKTEPEKKVNPNPTNLNPNQPFSPQPAAPTNKPDHAEK